MYVNESLCVYLPKLRHYCQLHQHTAAQTTAELLSDGTPSPAAPADAREQIGRQRSVRRRRRARGRARRLGGGRGGRAGSGSWCIARLAGGERGEIDQPPPTESTAAVAAPGTGPREHRREALRSARPRPNPSLGPQLLSQPMPTVERWWMARSRPHLDSLRVPKVGARRGVRGKDGGRSTKRGNKREGKHTVHTIW